MTQNRAAAEQLTLEVAGRAAAGCVAKAQLYRFAYEASRGTSCTVNGDPMQQMLAALDNAERAAVVLHKFHGLDCAEIAEILGSSPTVVAQGLIRSYQSLAALVVSESARLAAP
jgi:DNA-directed RNA polymerase specialized sigma24 family protein